MCSIFGVYKMPTSNSVLLRQVLDTLIEQSVLRGRDAFGLVWFGDSDNTPHRYTISDLADLVKSQPLSVRNDFAIRIIKEHLETHEIYTDMQDYSYITILANCRAAPTNESDKLLAEYQPYSNTLTGHNAKPKVWAVHNGTIANDQDWLVGTDYIDSKAIPVCYNQNKSLDKLIGSVATALYVPKKDKLILARNYCPLQALQVTTDDEDWVLFASELDLNKMNDIDTGMHSKFSYRILDLPANSTLTLKYRENKTDYSIVLKQKLELGTFFDKQANVESDKALVVLSGGLDSTTVATLACEKHRELTLIHFLYGCKAQDREVQAVTQIHKELQDRFQVNGDKTINLEFINLDFLKQLGGSTLTDSSLTVGQGNEAVEYAQDWVPFRNGLMLSMVAAYCDKNRIGSIYLGANLEEAGAYGDNQVEFFNLFEKAIALGSKMQTKIYNPLAHFMKHEIAELAVTIDAPIQHSWSCYHSSQYHCGNCGPCLLRKKAFQMCGKSDPTVYQPL